MAKDDDGSGEVVREFAEAVNLTPAQLENWLQTEESRSVGAKDDAHDESTGHAMGRQIVELLHKRKADYGDEDYQRMRKVTGYVHRHLAQRPAGDVTHTRWRYSLMNWGHDPLQD